jgi:transposase
MSDPTILADPGQVRLLSLSADATGIMLTACTRATQARCPCCDRPSARMHSRYTPLVQDLPWQGIPVRMRLHTRRFFCDHPGCTRQIFTERLPGAVASYARHTDRLSDWVARIAFALSGKSGARLLRKQGVFLSCDSLLSHICAHPVGRCPMPRVLDVDDFALRRSGTYGTILVDLERHYVVDLLPGRTASALASWLVDHPGPEIIVRDRDGEYRQGASTGAPSAWRVADRFHLLRNLREVMLRNFNRHAPRLAPIPAPGHAHQPLTRHRQDRDASRERTRAGLQAMFDWIDALAAQRLTKSAIAWTLGVHRHTVQKYLSLETPPSDDTSAARPASRPHTRAISWNGCGTDLATRGSSGRRSPPRAIPARTRTWPA